ncbi:MAG: DUF2461 domain-containing protein [Prevotellaceae bacterium]|nr:DUF2461 domain-containing protein [Prevotellaceae bacterium]
MNSILHFLAELAANNTREWFQANRSWYDQVRAQHHDIVRTLLVRISQFDPSVSHLDVKDCTYRIYRDVRFSTDKSPYKRHIGAYISAGGKKSCHAGYYLHLMPGETMLCAGTWYLPSHVLKEVRMSICEDFSTFHSIVSAPEFREAFPQFGYEPLKTMPKGFPADFSHPEYLRPRIYSCGCNFEDSFVGSEGWLDDIVRRCEIAKPFIDFLNDTIDDYEVS